METTFETAAQLIKDLEARRHTILRYATNGKGNRLDKVDSAITSVRSCTGLMIEGLLSEEDVLKLCKEIKNKFVINQNEY